MVRQMQDAVQDAKPWQAVLVDWQSGAPMVVGDPISRHWTRWGARRAAGWFMLQVLPAEQLARYRCAVLPTRHPALV